MNSIKVELRRRVNVEFDDINQLHENLIEGLRSMPVGFWNKEASLDNPDLSKGLECQINLGSGLPDSIYGYVAYVYRNANYIRNIAEFDDRLIFTAENLESIFYSLLVSSYFPSLIKAFAPYRAIINLDEDLALDDWDKVIEMGVSEGNDLDGRDGVFRIWPVSYYDRNLCKKAFDMEPIEIEKKLCGRAQHVEVIRDGILLIWSDSLSISREQIIEIDYEIRALLKK